MAWRHLRNHPRLLTATVLGIVLAWLLPRGLSVPTRGLIGFNTAVWLYLLLTWTMMARADHGSLRRSAVAHGEGALAVMCIAVGAVGVTLVAIVLELMAVKDRSSVAWSHLALTGATLVGSWLLLATLFALSYASLYYRHADKPGEGLNFPGVTSADPPTYADFLYFSFTLAATSQTSDVAVSARDIRTWVLAQAILSFGFNTVLLALAINTAASLF